MTMNNIEYKNKLKDALCNNDIDFLQKHINDFPIDERFEDENNDTLLMYSISDKNSESFKFLLENGASLSLINEEGETIVHSSIYSGMLERVKLVVNSENIDKNNNDEMTPLLLACLLGYQDIAIELLNLGANPNCYNNDGIQPIHIASQDGLELLLVKLINIGVSCYTKTKSGNLPISLAANAGHHNLVAIIYKSMYN